jgi:hypothetical protein
MHYRYVYGCFMIYPRLLLELLPIFCFQTLHDYFPIVSDLIPYLTTLPNSSPTVFRSIISITILHRTFPECFPTAFQLFKNVLFNFLSASRCLYYVVSSYVGSGDWGC